jgi:hypothetical protein
MLLLIYCIVCVETSLCLDMQHPTFLANPDPPLVQLHYTLFPPSPTHGNDASSRKAAFPPIPRLSTSSPSSSGSSTNPALATVLGKPGPTPQTYKAQSASSRTIRIPALKRKADSPAPVTSSMYRKVPRHTKADTSPRAVANRDKNMQEDVPSYARLYSSQSGEGDQSLTPPRVIRDQGVRFISP